MATISLCMIVKNEQDTLENCLYSIADLVDEIIIVDTGSTDNTKLIAKKYTDKIYDFVWVDDFSAARNYSFDCATKDYVMWLDADDLITQENRTIFANLKNSLDGKIKQIAAKYDVGFNDMGQVTLSYYRERIMLKEHNYRWIGPIHEVIPLDNDILYSEFTVKHNKIHPTEKGRNLRIFKKMIEQNIPLDTRQTFYYARELYYNGKYEEAKKVFQSVIQNDKTWIENRISACIDLYKCNKALGENDEAIKSLLNSFVFTTPKAEVCCSLANELIERKRYEESAYWYKAAMNDKIEIKNGGFVNNECYQYIPAIGLCVVYDRMGDLKTAEYYNDIAEHYKPGDKSVEINKKYFQNMKNKK